jgi:hypothetical protein
MFGIIGLEILAEPVNFDNEADTHVTDVLQKYRLQIEYYGNFLNSHKFFYAAPSICYRNFKFKKTVILTVTEFLQEINERINGTVITVPSNVSEVT